MGYDGMSGAHPTPEQFAENRESIRWWDNMVRHSYYTYNSTLWLNWNDGDKMPSPTYFPYIVVSSSRAAGWFRVMVASETETWSSLPCDRSVLCCIDFCLIHLKTIKHEGWVLSLYTCLIRILPAYLSLALWFNFLYLKLPWIMQT